MGIKDKIKKWQINAQKRLIMGAMLRKTEKIYDENREYIDNVMEELIDRMDGKEDAEVEVFLSIFCACLMSGFDTIEERERVYQLTMEIAKQLDKESEKEGY